MTLRQRRFAVFAALNLLLLVGGWFALVSPQRHDAAAAAAQAQVVQNEIASLTNGSSQAAIKQPVIHTSDLYALDTALPAQEDQPDEIFELRQVAAASGVNLLDITPQPAQAATANYTVRPITLRLSGSYFRLTRFLRSLRMLVSHQHGRLIAHGPLFAVTSVGLVPDSTRPGKEVATVGIAAFYYGLTAGATPPPVSTTTTDTTTTAGG